MARQEELDALQIKLDEREVELSAANVEINTLNICKLAIQNQLNAYKDGFNESEKKHIRKDAEIRALKERVKLGYEYTQDVLQNREG